MTDSFILTIESGPQQGATLELKAGQNRVGVSLDNDVVVSDTSISAAHFVLECGSPSVLRALEPGIRLESGATLRTGQLYSSRQSFLFSVGNTLFRFDQSVTSPPPDRADWRIRLVAPAALAVCALCLLVVFAPAAGTTGIIRPPPGKPTVHPVSMPSPTDRATLTRVVALRLEAANLPDLNTGSVADGAISVSGDLTPEQRISWNETKQWFDGAYGSRAVLIDRTRSTTSLAPLSIAAVNPGPSPFIIDRSGQKLFPGSKLPNGWTVDRIEAERVVVRRDGQVLAVRF